MANVVIYPRGFLGFDIGLPAENKTSNLSQLLQDIKLNKTVDVRTNLIANHYIDSLWKQYKTGDRFINSMGFREQILTTALKAFGTQSFLEWCILQTKSPSFTEMHKRFMNDTFRFLMTGKRGVNILNWINLINVRELTVRDDLPEYQYADYFGLDDRIEYRENITIVSAIKNWTSKVNGFDDLLGSLHIFFGDRDLV